MSRRFAAASILVVVASLAVLAAAQEPAMPKPGPEHQAMAMFVGKWKFDGTASAGAMGPGGKIAFNESCEWYEGGFAVVCNAEGMAPTGPTKSHSIMSYDADKKAYTYYAIEKGVPPFTALGKRDGKTWNWDAESKMGSMTMKTKVTVTETSATSYTFDMKASMDGGATWTQVMSGKSTKSGT
jgi:hypothetical protein